MPGNINVNGQPNIGADYHAAELYAYLKHRGVAKHGDAPFHYSNLGFGLLGQVLADRADTTYGELLRAEITGPLGLGDTAVVLSPEQESRVMQAYNRRREPLAAWDLDALRGCRRDPVDGGRFVAISGSQSAP